MMAAATIEVCVVFVYLSLPCLLAGIYNFRNICSVYFFRHQRTSALAKFRPIPISRKAASFSSIVVNVTGQN